MNLKLIGSILILGSCTCCGFSIARQFQTERKLLRQLQYTLQNMISDLQYKVSPLPDLIHNAAMQTNSSLKILLQSFEELMLLQKYPDASSCMAAALASIEDIPDSARRILTLMGLSIGRFDMEGQLSGFQQTMEALKQELQRCDHSHPQQVRCYRLLGICAGISLAVLLI